jgi:DNA modification methylase
MVAMPEGTKWQHCYDDGWKGLIVPEAFAHPAKFSRGLIKRIISHGFDRGWWRAGDLIADPFGGVALGGIMAGYFGLNWCGVELEERFCKLGRQNIALHAAKWRALAISPRVVLCQGDSRHFSSIISMAGAVVTSPPYAGMSPEKGSGGVDIQKQFNTYRNSGGGQSLAAFIKTQEKHSHGYGCSDGQIGALREGKIAAVLTSPPYAESLKPETPEQTAAKQQRIAKSKQMYDGRARTVGVAGDAGLGGGYGDTDGNIGALKSGAVAAVVTSPPFADSDGRKGGSDLLYRQRVQSGRNPNAPGTRSNLSSDPYGTTEGQIGNDSGETYWAAMSLVYRQCFLALRPGGIACVVVKDYVQNKKRVRLCDDTLRLLEHIGFEPVERIHAMLVKETRTPALFGGEHVKTTERKSFFRRLAERKGSPRIDWEEVLVVRKPSVANILPERAYALSESAADGRGMG